MEEKGSSTVSAFAADVAQFTRVPNHAAGGLLHPKHVAVVSEIFPTDRVVLASGASEHLDDLFRSTNHNFY